MTGLVWFWFGGFAWRFTFGCGRFLVGILFWLIVNSVVLLVVGFDSLLWLF